MKSRQDSPTEGAGKSDSRKAPAAMERKLARLRSELEEARKQGAKAKELADERGRQLQRARGELDALKLAAHSSRLQLIEHFRSSTSWRLTSPLRWLKGLILRLLGRPAPEPPSAAATLALQPRPAAAAPGPEPRSAPAPAAAPTLGEGAAASIKDVLRGFFRLQLSLFLASHANIRFRTHRSPDVSVILVLFNQAELTYACLRALEHCAATSPLKLDVVILDNASTDRTPELLSRISGVKTIHSPTNLHFLRGINVATAEARGKSILLLNNDALLLPGSLEAAFATLNSAEDIGAVGGRIVQMDGRLQEAGSIVWNDGSCRGYGRGCDPLGHEYAFRRDVDYCSGAFLLTRRTLFAKMGRFDETFAPAYYEETDYCMRLWKSGHRVVYEPEAVVLHYEFGSSAATDDAIALQQRNSARFYAKHRRELARHWAPLEANVLKARSHARGRKRILVLDDRIPHRALGSGYPRANDILRVLVDAGFEVTLYPVTTPDDASFDPYCDIPREVELVAAGGADNLEAFLCERAGLYDIAFISRPHNMEVVNRILARRADVLGGAKIVYDAEALFAVREALKRELFGEALSDEMLKATIDEEVAIARRASRIVTVSEAEAAKFRERGLSNVGVVGHQVAPAPTKASFAGRSGILFVGAIHSDDSPNADSVVWFVQETWPRLRAELAGAELLVVGMNASERVSRLNGAGVRICGYVDDLKELYDRCRVFVAPTRFAAGIPYKAHDAAAHGLPIVCTSLIARQLGVLRGGAVRIADTPEQFACSVLELYSDEKLWSRTRRLGLAMVEKSCSAAEFRKSLLAAVATRSETSARGRAPTARSTTAA